MITLRLWAIRHAPTFADGLCVGASDVPTRLAPDAAAARMVERIPGGAFTTVWSSPRHRCAAPARMLARKLGLPLNLADRLDEMSFGTWEGRAWREIEAEDAANYAAWLANWTSVTPPGGERLDAFAARVRSWWTDLCPGHHVLVAHAGVVRALRVIADGADWPSALAAPVRCLEGEWLSTREMA